MDVVISIIGACSSLCAIIFGLCALFFSIKGNKREDTKSISDRIARDTRVDLKLDETVRNTNDIKSDLSSLKAEINRQNKEIMEIKSDFESKIVRINSRLDTVEELVNLIRDGGK